jgi:hypothetical protein
MKKKDRNKRIGIFNILGASGPSGLTGLSACIFFACGKKGCRFNPLRVRRGNIFSGMKAINRRFHRFTLATLLRPLSSCG